MDNSGSHILMIWTLRTLIAVTFASSPRFRSLSLWGPRCKIHCIQSTPKPGPCKWDLWDARPITAPIEVSPRFKVGAKPHELSEGLWKASHMRWSPHGPRDQGLASDTLGSWSCNIRPIAKRAAGFNLQPLPYRTLRRSHPRVAAASWPRHQRLRKNGWFLQIWAKKCF